MLCPHCRTPSAFYDIHRGEVVCTRCGLVIVDKAMEYGPERRAKPSESSGRADLGSGVDYTTHDLGIGSHFEVPRGLTPSQRAKLRRMHFLHRRSRASDWSDRSLREQMLMIEAFCRDLMISKNIRAEVCVLYKKTRATGLTVGRDSRIVLAALVFLVARNRGLPRTEKEILRALDSRYGLKPRRTVKVLRKTVKLFSRKLGITPHRMSCADYIAKFSAVFRFSRLERERANKICSQLAPRLKHKSPRLAAAAVLYLAGKNREDITMQRISDLMGVGLASLSLTVKSFREHLAAER